MDLPNHSVWMAIDVCFYACVEMVVGVGVGGGMEEKDRRHPTITYLQMVIDTCHVVSEEHCP